MSRNIKARRRMPIAQRRQNYRELTFNKCGPDLRWRQHFDDNWDIIWPSSHGDYSRWDMWHPILSPSPTIAGVLSEQSDIGRVYLLTDPRLEYGFGEFENTLLCGPFSNSGDTGRTTYAGFDVPDDGPYALDYRHGPDCDQPGYASVNALLWRVRRPWWVI